METIKKDIKKELSTNKKSQILNFYFETIFEKSHINNDKYKYTKNSVKKKYPIIYKNIILHIF